MNGELFDLVKKQLQNLDQKKIREIEVRHDTEDYESDRVIVDITYDKQ